MIQLSSGSRSILIAIWHLSPPASFPTPNWQGAVEWREAQSLNPVQENGTCVDIVLKMYSPFSSLLMGQSATLTRWGILVFDDKRRFEGPHGSLPRFLQTMCQTGDD